MAGLVLTMRIVDLAFNGPSGPPTELHPGITVLGGLDASQRALLLESIADVCRGENPGIGVTIEVHDILTPVSADALAALELGVPVDVIVRANELGGPASGGPAPPAAAPSPPPGETGDGARPELRAEVARHDEAVAAAERTHDEAAATADGLGQRLQEAAGAVRDAEAARAAAEATRGSAGDELDGRLAELEAERQAQAARSEEEAAGELSEALADRDEARAGLDAALNALEACDHVDDDALLAADDAVADARGAVDALAADIEGLRTSASSDEAGAAEIVELEAALARADEELTSLAAAVGGPDEGVISAVEDARASVVAALDIDTTVAGGEGAEDPDVLDARARVVAAAEALREADAASGPVTLAAEDVEAMERAHEEVEDAEARVERALSGLAARRRLKEAKEREREVLDRLGFPSYGTYLLESSALSVDPAAQRRVAEARVALAEAERHLADAEAEAARRRVSAEIEEERSRERARAEAVATARSRLLDALAAAGADAQADAEQPALQVVDDAAAWLAGARRALEASALAERQLSHTHAHRQELARRLEEAQLQLAERRAAEAQRRAEVIAEAERAVADAQRGLEAATQTRVELRAAAEARAAADQQVAEARERVAAAEARIAAIEESVHGRPGDDRLPVATARVADARTAAEEADAELAARRAAVVQARARHDALADDLAAARAALARADAELTEARRRRDEAAALLERSPAAELSEALAAVAPASPNGHDGDTEPDAAAGGDPGVYVLARLAAQRNVGRAGALPLVLDHALDHLGPAAARPVLELFERMSSSVQVIVLSEEPELAKWADSLGIERAISLTAATA